MKQNCVHECPGNGRWLLLLVFAFLLSPVLHAQGQAPAPPAPNLRDLKVLEEYSDGRGNIVRVIQFSQGMMRVRQTIIMPKKPVIGTRVPISADTMKKEMV